MRVLLYGMLRAEGRRGVSAKRKNGGFSLLEMLLTVAILVILLGLSAVGVARWLHPLKITELDNAAREIYMAAENRVVLLKNSGVAPKRLASADSDPLKVNVDLTETGGEEVSLRVLSRSTDSAILNDMLPVGSIDPALREGYFYILYDDSTSHVFEVFYAEKPFPKTELNDLRVSRSDRVEYYRADTANHCLVGHYAGGLADKISNKELPKPKVEVIIENGDELTLTVKYEVPTDSLPTGVSVTRKPKVTLKYGGKEITLLEEHGGTPSLYSGRMTKNLSITDITNPPSATYTWVLDSLVDGSDDKSQQFRDLFDIPGSTLTFGDDFTVTASLELTADDYIGSSYSDEGTDNSLFAKDSQDTTAYIDNLRHLQNLDNVYSNAAGKSTAIQRADIDAGTVKDNKGQEKIENYKFRPIQNWGLLNYYVDSSPAGSSNPYYSITNLTVTQDSAVNKNGPGLFGSLADNCTIQNIRLVDSDISGTGPAGALLGSASIFTFQNCYVANTKVKSTGNIAGGLAGYWWGSAKFENCVIENPTVESSTLSAGGLAGGGAHATFTNCTVKAVNVTGGANAGGLAGFTQSTDPTIIHSSSTEPSIFTNCHVLSANVKGVEATGGLVGSATRNAEFKQCTVGKPDGSYTIEIGTRDYAGGLVGNAIISEFTDCEVTGANIKGTGGGSEVGGLIGRSEGVQRGSNGHLLEKPWTERGSVFTGCNATELTITGTGNASVGGLVGNAVDVHMGEDRNGIKSEPCTAKNVTVTGGSYGGGLVGNTTRGQFTGCKAINVKVTATAEVGGLIGRTQYHFNYTNVLPDHPVEKLVDIPSDGKPMKLDSCQVYWEGDMSDLKTGSELNYQIVGATAGGLVGAIRNGATIQNSFAATLVDGSSYAGGLVGNYSLPEKEVEYVKTVTIEKSYADCYIQAQGGHAGGLIGMKDVLLLKLEDVYATGFIKMNNGLTAGGLHGGWAMEGTTAKNAYTAMHYTGANEIYPLAAQFTWVNVNNCYWLKYDGIKPVVSKSPGYTSYSDMLNIPMGDAFTSVNADKTHPYGLSNNASPATSYPFPGLQGLPHYGDWLKP